MANELDATKCPDCGLIAVPPEPLGCERCGTPASQLEAQSIGSSGSVIGFAVVHSHHAPEPETPFVVVEVRLDDGPVVRSMLRRGDPDQVGMGQRVDGEFDDNDRFAFVAASGAGS